MAPSSHTDPPPAEQIAPDGSLEGAHALAGEAPPGAATDAPGAADAGRRQRRRLLAALALLLVLGALAAVALLDTRSPSHKSSAGGVPAGETTTSVTRRTLSESSTVDGTLAYGGALELYDRLAGTYTWLPSVGSVVERGGTLWRIDNLPVVLMYGSVPAYRTLREGVSAGPDVVELNRNLIDLGFDPYGAITDLQTFAEPTAAAVRRFQHANGLAETGELELGRVVFAPSARRVTAVHVQLGQDPPGAATDSQPPGSSSPRSTSPGSTPGSSSPGSTPGSSSPGSSPRSTSPGSTPGSSSPGSTRGRSPSRKAPSKKHAPSRTDPKDSPSSRSPGEGSPSGTGEDEAAAAAEAVLSTTPTQQLVQLKLKPAQQQLAHTGQLAPVTLPSGSVVTGRVIEVGSVASEASKGDEPGGGGESESATIPVTLALQRSVAHLDEAPVSVEFVKAVRRDVLAVPATALIATGGGGYAIASLEQGRRVQLPVSTGMFADGYVQVEGAGVREGLTVLESE